MTARAAIKKAGGLVSMAGAAERWGISKAAVRWHREQHEDFPAPVGKIGKVDIYLARELDAWREARQVKRNGGQR